VINPESGTKGILRGTGPDSGLLVDRVSKQDVIKDRAYMMTAGRLAGGSFYPAGISVGRVDGVNQSDTAPFKLVRLQPYADLDGFDQVVIARRHGRLPSFP
jgi:cell shape-determining protein MreC